MIQFHCQENLCHFYDILGTPVPDLFYRSVIKVAIKHCGLSPFVFGRVDLLSRQYSDLEDEFRMALQIEANRFKEVRQSLQSATDQGQPIQRGKALTAEHYRSRPTNSKR